MSVDVPAGRVLVVDDDPLNRMLLTRSLEQEGHRVGSAASGQEALEILREKPFDVVLLDIVMPELDGVSVLERLKRDPVLQHVPVIMISAVDEIDTVVRCIEMGPRTTSPSPSIRSSCALGSTPHWPEAPPRGRTRAGARGVLPVCARARRR
jgi:CheY-like chemotaxis protein